MPNISFPFEYLFETKPKHISTWPPWRKKKSKVLRAFRRCCRTAAHLGNVGSTEASVREHFAHCSFLFCSFVTTSFFCTNWKLDTHFLRKCFITLNSAYFGGKRGREANESWHCSYRHTDQNMNCLQSASVCMFSVSPDKVERKYMKSKLLPQLPVEDALSCW